MMQRTENNRCPTSLLVLVASVGGRDLSHETHGTETVESHQEPEVGLEEYANERHEPTVNETEEYGSSKKATNKKKNNNEGQD